MCDFEARATSARKFEEFLCGFEINTKTADRNESDLPC
jgi:hypothetical protein